MANSDRTKLWFLIVIVAISGIAIGVPLANTAIFLFAQVALILLTVRYRYIYVIVPCLIALLTCTVIYGMSTTMVFFFLALLPGLLMGYKARTFSTPRSIISWGFAPYLVAVLMMVLFYSELSSRTDLFVSEFQALMQESAAPLGVAAGDLEEMLQMSNNVIVWTLRLLPGILFTMFATLILFAYLGATSVAKYFGAVIPGMMPTHFWRVNELWLIPFGISMLFVLLGGEGIKVIGENLLVFFVHFYAFLGLCVIDFYLNQLNVPFPLRMIIYLIILLPVITIPLLALLGLIDSRFDFRKLAFESEN